MDDEDLLLEEMDKTLTDECESDAEPDGQKEERYNEVQVRATQWSLIDQRLCNGDGAALSKQWALS